MSANRSPWIAGLLNFLCVGLGFLYVGKPRWTLATLMVFPLLFGLAGWSGLVFSLWGLAASTLVVISVEVACIVGAVKIARHVQPAPLARYQRWYVYLGYFIAASFLLGEAIERRGILFNYEVYRFPSYSMAGTLLPGDYFVSNPRKFSDQAPARGDLIVFRYPADPTIKYVKRVIGLPGDTIVIKAGEVFANGTRLQEPYVSLGNNRGDTGAPAGPFRVPAEHFFVLGDNRDNSSDSRVWGSVPRGNLYGNVEYIWVSMDPSSRLRTERIGLRPQ